MNDNAMSPSDPVNILLVDDQPAKLLSYEVILDGLGDNLIKAGSAREALEHLLKKEIAVMLIDVCMPDLDGFELAAMIRGHPRFQRTAIIFVSAIAMTDLDRVKGYEHGAVDYVPVPVVPELLRAKVRIFAELYRKTRQLETLNIELENRVRERTAELAQANAELEQRVEERTREREMALAQVHEMQKLESLGQLTGGLAHDFNNLLMAALSNLDLLSKRVQNDPIAKRLIDGAIQSGERGAALTKRMLAFARRQELKPEIVDVARLVGSMAEMLQRSLGPSIQIGMDFSGDLALIRADRNQLELAILNLALNARDAMPEGGRLTLTARRDRLGGGAQGLAPGDYLSVSVTDTGCGMDEATLKRAAEPFFTTKGVGKGTGLGLSMVYGLAAQSGGGTRISSRIGSGTTVELLFPVIEGGQTTETGAPARNAAAECKPCHVLVVDDDSMVAESTAAMLSDLGHTVVIASSAPGAMERIRAEAKIDLVITDHAMPGMTGVELAKQIRQARPELPIILATGYADLPGGDDLGLPRLAKPYRQAELETMVAKLQAAEPDLNVIPIASGRRA
ncbi:MAG: hybrid sensor histidine kinase/response regulator [Rhodospirillales bacterium]|nr:hybrid sensor histidine kinase/response regulator [Rhodospirillales bacterium]